MEAIGAFSSPPSSGNGAGKGSRPDAIPGLSSLSRPGPGLEPDLATAHCRSLFSREAAGVLSPLTNLALDMVNLAVLGRYYYYFFFQTTQLPLLSFGRVRVC